MPITPLSRRFAPLAAACLLIALLAPAATGADAKAAPKPEVSVMSRNLYLGADIIKLVGAPDLAGEQGQVAALLGTVEGTNFPVRAKALAQEIATTRPDVIGLQEVARYYRSADATPGQAATRPLYDWMALLQKQLKARKQPYKVAAEQTELDITVPSADGYGLRLKLGNAVLVRTGKGARISGVKRLSGLFKDQLQVQLPSGKVELHRGYAGIDGKVAGRTFRFLDPHAEAYSAAAAKGQFQQLLAGAGEVHEVADHHRGRLQLRPRRCRAERLPGDHRRGLRRHRQACRHVLPERDAEQRRLGTEDVDRPHRGPATGQGAEHHDLRQPFERPDRRAVALRSRRRDRQAPLAVGTERI